SVWQLVFGDVVGPRRPDPDDFGRIAVVAVPALDMEDFVATGHEPAGVVLAKVQCGAKGRHYEETPVLWISPIADERRECRPSDRLNPLGARGGGARRRQGRGLFPPSPGAG